MPDNGLKFMLLNLPAPSGRGISRDYAGGFGIVGSAPDETLLPIHLLYGASALKNSGYEYDVLDAQAMNYGPSEVAEAVEKSQPDILISWVSLPAMQQDLELLNEIKKTRPDTLLIALGTVCNVMPEEILRGGNVDLAIKGWFPYYNTISDLVNKLKAGSVNQDMFDKIRGAVYVKKDEIVQSPLNPTPEDLNQLVFDVYRQLPIDKYRRKVPDANDTIVECISIITSAGCPYSCIYCPYPLGYGRKIVHKSIKLIGDEIEFLKKNFDITGFSFRDQLFTHDHKRVMDLCDEIISRGLNIKWHVEARADEVNEELLTKMKEAGCFRIHYGVETGSPELLRKIGKPGLSIEAIKRAFKLTKELGMATTAHIMVGLPGEDQKTLNDTLNLLCELNPDAVNVNLTTPYPGTRLFKMASEKGWISTYDWSKYTSYNAIMGTGNLSLDEVYKARNELRRKFQVFKLLHDPNYLRSYFKNLPRAMLTRLVSSLMSLGHNLQISPAMKRH